MTGYTLIIDDEPENCKMLTAALRMIGIDARSASGGAEALRMVDEDLPELIMLDLMMPEMSGYDVFKKLRSDPITGAIPIIVLSAYLDEHSRAELPGVEHILRKGDYRIPELRQLVAAAIGDRA
jgi:CheY-like chemotaxis protein